MKEIEELYMLYKRDIYQYLLSLTRHPSLAEDLLQETFVRAMTSVQQFSGRSTVKTWLFSIARNAWLETLRKREHALHPDAFMEQYLLTCIDEEVITNEVIAFVKELLLQKDERTQKITMMRAEGYSFAEIAAEVNVSESSARVIDYRTRKWLKRKLEEERFH